MPTVSTKSASQIRQSWIIASQASAAAVGKVLDYSVGSVFLAIAEGGLTIGLWLQKVALQVLEMTRFATSVGGDADSWGAQFQFDRLGAVAATGLVVLSRANTAQRAVAPVGQGLQTADGSQSFVIYADTANLAWSGPDDGYVIDVGMASVTVPAQASLAGVAGNVRADTITVVLGSITGVDSTTNPAAFLNGLDAESDPAYKARFPKYLAGLARANRSAIEAAIESVQQGLQYEIIENQIPAGSALPYYDTTYFFNRPGGFSYPTLAPWPGLFIVIVDDGSGAPPLTLITRVQNAIEAVRGLAVEYQVYGPSVMKANVAFTLAMIPGYNKNAAQAATAVAIQNFLNSRPLGTIIVPRTRLAQVAYDSVAGIANVIEESILINGQAADLPLNQAQVVKSGTVVIG